jgi:hypothetical protein
VGRAADRNPVLDHLVDLGDDRFGDAESPVTSRFACGGDAGFRASWTLENRPSHLSRKACEGFGSFERIAVAVQPR